MADKTQTVDINTMISSMESTISSNVSIYQVSKIFPNKDQYFLPSQHYKSECLFLCSRY